MGAPVSALAAPITMTDAFATTFPGAVLAVPVGLGGCTAAYFTKKLFYIAEYALNKMCADYEHPKKLPSGIIVVSMSDKFQKSFRGLALDAVRFFAVVGTVSAIFIAILVRHPLVALGCHPGIEWLLVVGGLVGYAITAWLEMPQRTSFLAVTLEELKARGVDTSAIPQIESAKERVYSSWWSSPKPA